MLFTTPVVNSIKESSPEAFIGYWCNERVQEIIRGNPQINKIYALSRGDIKKIYRKSWLEGIRSSLKLYFKIREERFDTCLDYSLDHRYSLAAKLLGIKRRIGFDYRGRGRFLTEKINLTGYRDRHVVEHYSDLLKFINIAPKKFNLRLYVSEEEKIAARKILRDCGISNTDLLVGVAPGAGASWGLDAKIKHWPETHFAQLCREIINKYGVKIVILGDISERPIAESITKSADNRIIDLTGKTSLSGLAAVIDTLQILIANDGGPLHIAVALSKKTVSFFGPVAPEVYGPYPPDEKRHIVLRRDLECSPCYKNFRLSRCLKNKECMEKIAVGEALEAVEKLFSLKEDS